MIKNKFPLKHFFYISNILSISRIILIFPIVYLIKINTNFGNGLLVLLVVLIILSDYFDGFMSRKLNQITDLGKLLDPLADKIAIAMILIALIYFRNFPVSLVILLLYRDLLILALGWFFIKKKGIPESNWWGKINTGLVSFTGFLFILNVKNIIFIIFYLGSYLTIIISAWSYYLIGERVFISKKSSKYLTRIVVIIISVVVLYWIFHLEFNAGVISLIDK